MPRIAWRSSPKAPIASSHAAARSSAGKCRIAILPKSVDTVNRILSDFREGRQSVAEFWLNFTGRFVHVRYFAVREAGEYLGTLEVTQDVSKIRSLEGERRLLEYE